MRLTETSHDNWLEKVRAEFAHPAIVLWRAVELREIQEALEKVDLSSPVLDLGCAEGRIAGLLFGEKKLIGLDNCWELLSQNKKSHVYQGLFLADARSLPYKDKVFGSVFSNCVIEHIPDMEKVLQEVCRVIKDRGIFLFTVPSHKFEEFLCFSTIFERLGLKGLSSWYKKKRNNLLHHFHCYTHTQWKGILEETGFTLIWHKYYMPQPAAFYWDFLAAVVAICRRLWPLNFMLGWINKWLNNNLERYYNMQSSTGAGLLLVAQRGG